MDETKRKYDFFDTKDYQNKWYKKEKYLCRENFLTFLCEKHYFRKFFFVLNLYYLLDNIIIFTIFCLKRYKYFSEIM